MSYKAPNLVDFQREILLDVWTLISEKAAQRARDVTPSRALAQGMRVEIDFGVLTQGFVAGGLVYDQYWALMLHDGHGPIVAKNTPFLVYYANPHNDPRIQPVPNGYPTRVNQRRFLNASDWQKINAENKARRNADLPPFAYIVKRPDTSGPHAGFHWLEPETPYPVGMGRFSEVVSEEASLVFRAHVARHLPKGGARQAKLKIR